MIVVGDVRQELARLEPESFDAVLCDPPYELGFMGRAWDRSGVAFDADVWRGVLRACRPGAHLMAAGGTRTYHRMACAIEDAGWEIRDTIAWMYGSGFPKSLDVSKALDAAAGAVREVVGSKRGVTSAETGRGMPGKATGIKQVGIDVPITAPSTLAAAQWSGYGTALKPAHEPITLARKPLDGTVAQNVAAHGCGGLAIDAGRVGTESTRRVNSAEMGYSGGNLADVYETGGLGRWPANVILDHEAGAMLDAQTGTLTSGVKVGGGYSRESGIYGGGLSLDGAACYADSGGASRFFYCAKTSTSERNAGLDDLPELVCVDGREPESAGAQHARAEANGRSGTRNPHPTLKPIDLTRYLARLMLPPPLDRPRRLLVPFSGAGSEMIGALLAGWDEVVGIELSPEYADIARRRIAHWTGRTLDDAPRQAPVAVSGQLALF